MPKQLFASTLKIVLTGILVALGALQSAFAEARSENIPFGDKTLVLTDTGEGEQFITVDGVELVRNFYVGVETTATIYETHVMVLASGGGGNACGPDLLILWIDADSKISKLPYDANCQTPVVAVANDSLIFVPYVGPGDSELLKNWSPEMGLVTSGRVDFAPEPGTDWATLAESPAMHPLDFFANEALYTEAKKLLGNNLALFALGLGTASEPRLEDNNYISNGCVPHNCGGQDSLIIVDPAKKTLFMAQQASPGFKYWPEKSAWSETASKVLSDFEKNRGAK